MIVSTFPAKPDRAMESLENINLGPAEVADRKFDLHTVCQRICSSQGIRANWQFVGVQSITTALGGSMNETTFHMAATLRATHRVHFINALDQHRPGLAAAMRRHHGVALLAPRLLS